MKIAATGEEGDARLAFPRARRFSQGALVNFPRSAILEENKGLIVVGQIVNFS